MKVDRLLLALSQQLLLAVLELDFGIKGALLGTKRTLPGCRKRYSRLLERTLSRSQRLAQRRNFGVALRDDFSRIFLQTVRLLSDLLPPAAAKRAII